MAKQSTLSTAAAAHDNERLAAVNVKRNVVEHCPIAEFSDKVFYLDDGGVCRHDQNEEALMTNDELMTKLE
jgi:hypothetical protein